MDSFDGFGRQSETSQSQVLCLWRDGGEALNELFGACMPRLFRVADCILHNYHDSKDALQEGLLSALCHLDQFKGNSRFSTWLHSIVRNSALEIVRRQRAHVFIPVEEPASEEDNNQTAEARLAHPQPDPDQAHAQSEITGVFNRILELLPTNYRAIVQLCDFEGLSSKEAAERLGLTVSALKAKHHRARQAVRKSLRAKHGYP